MIAYAPFPKILGTVTGHGGHGTTVTDPCGRCGDAGPSHQSNQCWTTYKQGPTYGGILCRCPGWVPEE